MYFTINGAEVERRRTNEGWERALLARMTRLQTQTIKRIEDAGDKGYRTRERTIEAIYQAFQLYGSEEITIGDLSVDYHPPVENLPRVHYDQWELRRARAEANLSYSELAERSGLTAAGIHRLEHAKRPSARAETIIKVAHGLGVPVGRICQPLATLWGTPPRVHPPE